MFIIHNQSFFPLYLNLPETKVAVAAPGGVWALWPSWPFYRGPCSCGCRCDCSRRWPRSWSLFQIPALWKQNFTLRCAMWWLTRCLGPRFHFLSSGHHSYLISFSSTPWRKEVANGFFIKKLGSLAYEYLYPNNLVAVGEKNTINRKRHNGFISFFAAIAY